MGRTASSKPPYASHTLVQINQNSQPKSILLKSYFQFDRMQIRYFCEKLREHYLVQRCWYSRQNHPTLMAFKIAVIKKSDSMDPMQRWLHNWNQGHWRPTFIIDIPWCMTQLECCTILENSRKNIFQFLSGDLQGRLPKICLATFPWLFVFKVLSVKYLMAYHFIGPDGPINMASTNPLLFAKSVEFQKTF